MTQVGASPYGYTGLLGQTTPPTAPNLSGTVNNAGQFNLSAVLAQLQQSQNQANQANVTRYNNLLQGIQNTSNTITGSGGTYQQALSLLGNQGQAAAQQIAQNTQQQIAGSNQNLVSRGLGNTTVGVNLENQANQQGQQALNASNEAVAGQQAGVLQNLAGAQMQLGNMQAQGIQSLNQQAPNQQLYSDMIKQFTAGQAQAAQQAKTQAAIANQNQQQAFQSAMNGGLSAGSNMGGGSGGGGIGGGGNTYGGGGGSSGPVNSGSYTGGTSFSGGSPTYLGTTGEQGVPSENDAVNQYSNLSAAMPESGGDTPSVTAPMTQPAADTGGGGYEAAGGTGGMAGSSQPQDNGAIAQWKNGTMSNVAGMDPGVYKDMVAKYGQYGSARTA